MRRLLIAMAALCVAASSSYAQQVNVPGVQAVGTPQAPNVAVWFNPTTLSDSGVPLSGLTAGITNVVAHDPIAASIAATTLSIGVLPKPANTVLAGPTSGGPGAVTARPLTNADMPVPTTTALGGVEAILHVAHEWIDSISTLGAPNLSQPAFTDISGTLTNGQLAQMPADTVKCNNTGVSATPIDCTVTQLKAFVNSAPQVTVLTPGSVSPYSTPSGALYIVVEMAGGGGGGSGSGGAGIGNGGNGGNSTFGTLTANGGTGGTAASTNGGTGGSASGGDINETGSQGGAGGGAAGFTNSGPQGGSNAFGGGGTGTISAAGNAGSGFGAGGAGGAFSGSGSTSAAGGGGGYLRKLIGSPAASYAFSIGSHGTAGGGGGGGAAGAQGGDGIAVVSAYFQ